MNAVGVRTDTAMSMDSGFRRNDEVSSAVPSWNRALAYLEKAHWPPKHLSSLDSVATGKSLSPLFFTVPSQAPVKPSTGKRIGGRGGSRAVHTHKRPGPPRRGR